MIWRVDVGASFADGVFQNSKLCDLFFFNFY